MEEERKIGRAQMGVEAGYCVRQQEETWGHVLFTLGMPCALTYTCSYFYMSEKVSSLRDRDDPVPKERHTRTRTHAT